MGLYSPDKMNRFLGFGFLLFVWVLNIACTREPDNPAPTILLTNAFQPNLKEVTVFVESPIRLKVQAQAADGIDSITCKVFQDSIRTATVVQGFPLPRVGSNPLGTSFVSEFTVGVDPAFGDALVSIRIYDKKGRTASSSYRVRARISPYKVSRRTFRIFGQDTVGGGNVGNFYSFRQNRVTTRTGVGTGGADYDFAYGVLNVGLRTFISPNRYGQNTSPITGNPISGARSCTFRRTTLNLDSAAINDPILGEQVMLAPEGDENFYYSVSDDNPNFIVYLDNGKRILVDVKTPVDTRQPWSKRFLDLTILMVEPR